MLCPRISRLVLRSKLGLMCNTRITATSKYASQSARLCFPRRLVHKTKVKEARISLIVLY